MNNKFLNIASGVTLFTIGMGVAYFIVRKAKNVELSFFGISVKTTSK